MLKKVFVLASVTALAGLVMATAASGCSTNVVSGTLDVDASEAAPPIKKPIEAGPDPVEDSGPKTCPTTAPIDVTTNEWKPPAILPGSCTEAQIVALVKTVTDNTMIAYKDLKASVTDPVCRACLFAPDGAKWAALVEDAMGAFMRHNFGGCVAAVSGQEACGKAYSQFDDCINQACTDCADATTLQNCTSPAEKGACKVSFANVSTVCGNNVSAIDTCQMLSDKYLFESAARALCVGIGDGGIDGGDGGDGG